VRIVESHFSEDSIGERKRVINDYFEYITHESEFPGGMQILDPFVPFDTERLAPSVIRRTQRSVFPADARCTACLVVVVGDIALH